MLLAWALLFGSGTDPGRLAWLGGAAVLAACACVALLPRPRLGRAAWAFFGLFTAYAAWVAVSLTWSWSPDRAWDAFDRDVVYLAFAVLGVYLARLGIERLGMGLGLLVALVCGWALLTRVVPALDSEAERVGRLREPIGYWNVLALVLVLGLPLALRLRRDLASVAVYGLSVALLLTYSRGGIVAALVALVAYALIARPALYETAAVVAAGAVPAALVFATDSDGAFFALLLALGGAVAYVLGRFAPVRIVSLAGAAGVAVAAVAFVVAVGNPASWAGDKLDEFRNPPTAQRAGDDLLTASSNNRWTWWAEAADAWQEEPVAGTGAGSFELVHRQLRENDLHTTDPHSLPLAVLSETGIVGLVLFLAAAGCAIAAAAGGLRRLAGAERGAAAALAAGGLAYLAHSLVDMHWQYVAATAPVFMVAGALVGGNEPPSPRPSRIGAAAAGLTAVALLYSLAAPALAERRVESASKLIAARDFASAIDRAESASSLNPLAVEPLFALGLAADLAGDDARALEAYEDAVSLQPENWRTWYELGFFEYVSLKELDAAFLDLDKAYSLDPRNVVVGRTLDSVRDTLNKGG